MTLNRYFNAPERALGAAIIVLTLLWPAMAIAKGVRIHPELTATALGIQTGLVVLGLYFRLRLRLERLAKFCIAFGFYFFVLTSVSNIVRLRFPIDSLAFDELLQRTDDWLGVNWSEIIVWMSEHPLAGNLLADVYRTSLAQIGILVVFLTLSGRDRTLYRFLYTAAISLAITVAIWCIAPSFGPSVNQDIPPGIAGSYDLIVNQQFKDEIAHLVQNGSDTVPSTKTLGLVAFPSYHTIMSLLVVVYAWNTVLRWPSILVNLLMPFSIVGQGGHYVIDVVGGLVVFLVALKLSHRWIGGPETWPAPASAAA